jgi:hypothetical protein
MATMGRTYFENMPNQVLHAMGLRRESEISMLTNTVLPAFAVFGAGLLVGAGIALLVTPKTGRELRDDLSRRAGEFGETVRNRLPQLTGAGTGENIGVERSKSIQNTSPV